MTEVDQTVVHPFTPIQQDIITIYESFESSQKLPLADDKCQRIRTYFQGGIKEAQSLENHVYYAGLTASISLILSGGSSYFSKHRPNLHKFSTVALVIGIIAAFLFVERYIKRDGLQTLFSSAIELGDGKDESQKQDALLQLQKVSDVMLQGSVPEHSYANINGKSVPLLAACIAKGSFKTAIMVAAMYENKELLAKHAKESFAYIKGECFDGTKNIKAVCFLELLGASPKEDDSELLNSAADRLNFVAMKELIRLGVKKDGGLPEGRARAKAPIEYAIDATLAKKDDIKQVLSVFGAIDYSSYTNNVALSKYLNGQNIRISDDYAQKILDLLNPEA